MLRACFAAYKKRLVDIAHGSLEMATDLFENNEYVTQDDVLEFKIKRAEWHPRFAQALDDLFEKRLAGHKRKGRRPDFDASLASLRVLTAFDHEKQDALKSSTSFLLRLTRRELDALDLRLELLLTADRGDLDNPFGPAYILDAIGSTSRAVWPHARVWRPAMERILDDLTPAVNKIYISLNRLLADHHVLPEIKAALRLRSEHRPADDRDLLPAFSKLIEDAGDVPTNVIVPEILSDPGAAAAFNFDQAAWQPGTAQAARPVQQAPRSAGPGGAAPQGAMAAPAAYAAPPAPAAPGAAPVGYVPVPMVAASAPVGLSPATVAAAQALHAVAASNAAANAAAANAAAALISPEIIAGLQALARLSVTPTAPAAELAPGELPSLDPLMALGTATPLFATLGKWQRLDLANALAAAMAPPAAGVAATPVPMNLVPHIRSAIADQITTPTDKVTVDVIALLFDYIFRDPSIPPSLRSLFGRLQVPIVKVALLDRTFFSERNHPARLLLDHLAEAAVGAQNDDTYRAGFEQAASQVIDEICRDFEIDVSAFHVADTKLAEFIETERHQSVAAMKPDVEEALAAEENDADRSYTRAFVRDRLAGLDLPFEVRSFAETTWADYLAALRAAHGETSAQWLGAVGALDDLLWSIVAKERTAQKARLTKLIPGLIRNLRGGIVAEKVSPERAQKFMEEIYQLHIAAIKPADPQAPAPQAATVPATASRAVTNVHDYVSEMAPGTWLAFRRGEETVNARLAWVSPLRTKYIFTSRARRRAFIYSPEELAYQLGAGECALVVEPVPLFDRAVSAAMDTLATKAPPRDAAVPDAAIHSAA